MVNELPLITIGIPTFQRPETLVRALQSALRQTYPRIEIIVSNNDPDQALQLIEQSELLEHPRVKVFNQERNLGQIGNYKFLIEQARGEYFMFVNDDDEIAPKSISALHAHLASNARSASVIGHWILEDSHGVRTASAVASFSGPTFRRIAKFILHEQDVAFHGLHRTAILKNARWPEFRFDKLALTNVCYPVLFDILIQGEIRFLNDPDVQLLNRVGHLKFYKSVSSFGLLARKVELYWIFLTRGLSSLGVGALLWLPAFAFLGVFKSISVHLWTLGWSALGGRR